MTGRWKDFAAAHARLLGTCSGAAVLLAVVCITAAVMRPAPVPRLEVSTTRLDLGEGKPGETLGDVLSLHNVGSAPCEFTITATCSCAELSPRRGTIAPGKSQDVRVALALPHRLNADKSARLSIETNEPQQPVYHCTLTASCPSPFSVEPAFVEFGRVFKKSLVSLSADIHVEMADDEQRTLRARVAGGTFEASFQGEHRDILRVTPATELLSIGDHHDSLELSLEGSSDYVLRIPLHVYVSPPLSTVPSTLILRKDPAGGFHSVELIVIVERDLTALGRLHALNAPTEFRLEEIGRIDDHRRRYRLSIADGWTCVDRFTLTLEDPVNDVRCDVLLTSPIAESQVN